MSRTGYCLFVAFANLTQHRTRHLVAALGTAVPIVLLFFQFAFLDAARIQITRLYDYFDFELVLIPQTYQFLVEGGTFDRSRLAQARAIDGVGETFSLNIASTGWIEPTTERRSTLLLIGLDEPGRFLRDAGLRNELDLLNNSRSVLVDDFSDPDFGPLNTGATATIAGQLMDIAGHFQLGLFFYTDGSAIVRNTEFPRLVRRAPQEVSLGLIRATNGADAAMVKERLARALPSDVRVLTRDELFEHERGFFLSTKPIGIVLDISMWIAFLAGAVILLQVLSTEIVNRMTEFAVLKTMGFSTGFVFGIGFLEVALMAAGAFLPALAAGSFILGMVEQRTHLPTEITLHLTLRVLVIVLLMALLSATIALRRLPRADPVELYQ
jgi:putative ABC transport system permease protein